MKALHGKQSITHDTNSLGPICVNRVLRSLRGRACGWRCQSRTLIASPVVSADVVAELSKRIRGRGPSFTATASATVFCTGVATTTDAKPFYAPLIRPGVAGQMNLWGQGPSAAGTV